MAQNVHQNGRSMTDTTNPPAVVHVDLDGATDIYRVNGWAYDHSDDPVFTSGMHNLLAMCDDMGVTATLFTIGSSLDDPHKRELLEEARDRGHEIAAHSMTHPLLTTIGMDERRREIEDCRNILERTLNVTVRGFRAPGYHIDRSCFEMLDAAGYMYDSSAFPNPHASQDLGNLTGPIDGPGRPFEGLGLIEVPLPDYRPWPIPFSPSYALTLGSWLFRQGVRRVREQQVPFTLLYHLIDFSGPIPATHRSGFKQKVLTLSHRSEATKVARCRDMLVYASRYFVITSTDELLGTLEGT